MLKTIKKSFLAVVLAVATLFALTSCVITGGGQTTTDPTLDAQAALSEFTEQVTFANTAEVTTSFNLPAAGKKGNYQIPITWTSNNEAVIAVTDLVEGGTTSTTHKKASVTRPAVGSEDVTVTLTAEFSLTYTKNDGTSATLKETKTYNFTVLAKTADADAPEDIATLEVGVPYKLGMYQEAKEKTLYALNAMSGFYGASTETLEDADDVYVEEATNGYYIYFLDGTTKTYISCAYELGSDGANHFNYKLTDTASTVWAYDATAQKLTTVIEGTELVLGTKSTYYTFSADEENIYFAHFYESPTASMTEDEKKVAADAKALEIATTVTENITLPATGANGSTITWESSNTAAIAADGTVTRAAEDVVVTLTATIKSGEASEVVEFEVKVVGNNSGSVIELTVDSLGIENGKYLAGTPTVGGIGFEYIQLGNYGNGIQMRDKDGNTSKLWSTTALGTGIVKIELVFNSVKSTHDNANAVIFSFGNAVDNLTYTTKLTTVAGTKTYTITPDANTYTYLYIEHDIEYSFYWDSIKIYYNEGTSGETPEQPEQPEVPVHECTPCPECTLCTDPECDKEESAKCQGHEPVEPTYLTVAEVKALTSGATASVKGVVIAKGTESLLIQDETGAIMLYKANNQSAFGETMVGDVVTAEGKYSPYNGLHEVANLTSLVIAEEGTAPAVKELSAIDASTIESLQCQIVSIELTYVSGTVAAKSSATFKDANGTTITVYGDSKWGTVDTMTLVEGTVVKVTGFVNWYNAAQLTNVSGYTFVEVISEPEVPVHECTPCPECTLCTDPECDKEESAKCQGHEVVEPEQPVVSGGRADLETIDPQVTSGIITGGYSQYNKEFTSTNGWTSVNSSLLVGGTADSNPVFMFIGADNTTKAVTINGNTTAKGVLTSPTLTGGISKLTFNYGHAFSDKNGVDINVTITDASGNKTVLNLVKTGSEVIQKTAYTAEFVLATPVLGDFTIEFTNNSPSQAEGNKDRVSLWNIEWVGATGTDTPLEPEQPTDAEKLAEAKEALVLGVTEATENITLPATGLNDVVITWASNNEAIATDGTVTRGATDVEVTLTATLTLGEATDTKEFTVVVKAAEQPETPAEPKTYAHTFAKDEIVKAGGQATLSGINWTSSELGYLGWEGTGSARGVQLGSGNAPAGTFTLKTNEISGKISKIVVNGSIGSKGDGKLTVTVNGTQVGSTISLTTTATDYTFDVSDLSGEIVLTFSNTAKAMYIKSVSVTYTE